MTFNPFEMVDGPGVTRRIEPTREQHDRLDSHMLEISGDPAGSNPEDYLSPEDMETMRRFIERADAAKWPGADEISMRTARFNDLPLWHGAAWKSGHSIAKAGLTKALFFPKVNEIRKGYIFGRLSVTPTEQVAICDDGKLRARRSTDLTVSNGIGWGKLPSPEIMEPVLATGYFYGVNYTNPSTKTLAEILKGQSGIDVG